MKDNLFQMVVYKLEDLSNTKPEKKKKGSSPFYDTIRISSVAEDVGLRKFTLEEFDDPKKQESSIEDFCLQMRKKSYAVLSLSEEEAAIIRRIWKISSQFFNESKELKDDIRIKEWRDVGYLHTKEVKEFWQMRWSDVDDFPWPSSPPDFKSTMEESYLFFDQLGRFFVNILARSLKIHPYLLTRGSLLLSTYRSLGS